MNFLDKIPTEAVATVAVLWILREVFGFVVKMRKNGNGKGDVQLFYSKQVFKITEKLSENIAANTEVLREMVSDFKLLRTSVVNCPGNEKSKQSGS